MSVRVEPPIRDDDSLHTQHNLFETTHSEHRIVILHLSTDETRKHNILYTYTPKRNLFFFHLKWFCSYIGYKLPARKKIKYYIIIVIDLLKCELHLCTNLDYRTLHMNGEFENKIDPYFPVNVIIVTCPPIFIFILLSFCLQNTLPSQLSTASLIIS